jgi:hypothetical protein
VAWAVYVSVVAGFGFVFYVRGVNGNTACFFFRRTVDLVVAFSFATELLGQNGGNRSSQSGLTMVNVTNGANVYVRFCPLKLFLSHGKVPESENKG